MSKLVIIRPANDLPVAVLDVHNFDEDFPSRASLEPGDACRWTTVDPSAGDIAALAVLSSFGYEFNVLVHPLEMLSGDAVTVYDLPGTTETQPAS